MLKTPRYVIAVRNLRESSQFFKDKLGFTIHKLDHPGWMFFERDNVSFLAGDCPDTPAAREIGDHSYIGYIEVEDVDALFDEYKRNGVEMIKPPTDEAHGMREFGIRTIDGHRIMFGQPK